MSSSSHYWQGARLTLRAIEPSDIELFKAFDDTIDRNVDAVYWPQPDRRRQEWLESELKPREDDSFRWIAVAGGGEAVGTIDAFACNRRFGTFKYGLALAPSQQGKGYGKEMIEMVLRFYFNELGYQKATPHVYSFNEASIKLHEKMGFMQEGRLRNMVYTEGRYFDEIYFGMTRDEFNEKYGAAR